MKIDPTWLIVGVSVLSALVIPSLAIMIRGAIKWTKTEEQVKQLVSSIAELVIDRKEADQKMADQIQRVVEDQGKIHNEMYEQMRLDRDATDRRLRFIEEYWMRRGQGTEGK